MPFHTCHGNARIDGARDSPADRGNATLMGANRHKTQQKRKMGESEMYEYAAENVLFLGTWWASS